MYVVSNKLAIVPSTKLQPKGFTLPRSYVAFLEEYGEGTYCGVLNIEKPDEQRMKDFTDMGFWIFDDRIPIKEKQLEECIVLVTSIDGDIFAIHPDKDQLLLFPRHSDEISLFDIDEDKFCKTLNILMSYLYSGSIPPAYFEPWNQKKSNFLRFKAGEFATIQALAKQYYKQFHPDFLWEDKYACEVFHKFFGGYVRFNYSYDEVAVFYDEEKKAQVKDTFAFLEQYVSGL